MVLKRFFNCEQTSLHVNIHSQGLTNVWKAFPSPLMVSEYHDIDIMLCKKIVVIIFLAMSPSPCTKAHIILPVFTVSLCLSSQKPQDLFLENSSQ